MRVFNKTTVMMAMAAAGLNLAACATDDTDEFGAESEDLDDVGGADGKFEAWNSANNPAYVDGTFLLYAHQLPLSGGRDKVPPSGDYWAVAKDGLNVKWDGASSLSPAAKYAKAFGKPSTPRLVSEGNGVLGHTERKSCTSDSECSDLMDGSICAHANTGDATADAQGRCIPTWWGICHGWAPYAVAELEPKNPVTRTAADGTQVTFYPGDILGLMSLMYTDIDTKFLSQRCNKDNPNVDSNGRVIAGECRDMNPGSWHVLVTNLMGLRKQGFVLDQTYDDEVWNQPTWKYAVTNGDAGQLKEISKEEAISMLRLGLNLTSLLGESDVAQGADKTGSYAATAAGELTFKLTGSGDADLYIKKGAAPTDTEYDCRPYESTSSETCKITVAAGDTVHWRVNGYATTSKVSLGVVTPGTVSSYTYNTIAKKFYYVEMDFTFVVESQPSRSLIDSALHISKKKYKYILEVDAVDKIIGGEWVGSSLLDHPDFAWWPTGPKTSGTVSGISWADVKALSDESVGPTPLPTTDFVTALDNFTFSNYTSKYASAQIPAGVKKLEVVMSGTGDADLYVRKGQNPTLSTYGCKSATVGTANETCTLNVSASGGTYYFRAKPKSAGANVTIKYREIR